MRNFIVIDGSMINDATVIGIYLISLNSSLISIQVRFKAVNYLYNSVQLEDFEFIIIM